MDLLSIGSRRGHIPENSQEVSSGLFYFDVSSCEIQLYFTSLSIKASFYVLGETNDKLFICVTAVRSEPVADECECKPRHQPQP